MNFAKLKEIVNATPIDVIEKKEIKSIRIIIDPETEYEYLYFKFKDEDDEETTLLG
jgi:hypothetical protein